MADETFAGRGISKIWIRGTGDQQKNKRANSTDLLNGLVCTDFGETAATNKVDVCGATEIPNGIILKPVINLNDSGVPRNLDANSVADESLLVQEKSGLNNTVYGTYQAGGATIKKGTPLIVGSEAGKLAPWVYSEAGAASVATGVYIVGQAGQDITTDGSNDQKIEVVI